MIRKMFFSLVLLSSCVEVKPMEGDRWDRCLHYASLGCMSLTCACTIYPEGRMATADGKGNFKGFFANEPSPFAEMICPLGTACCAAAFEALRCARLENVEEHEKSN